MVNELNELWIPGKRINTHADDPKGTLIRAALMCTACDIPAARKLNDFIGYNGVFECLKCWK